IEDKKEIIISETINIEDKKQSNKTKIILSDEYTIEIINIENINIPLKVKKNNKKQELQQLIDDGIIEFNYNIDCNSFTKDVEEHENVINSWLSTYGRITGLKKKIKNMHTSSKQKLFKKSVSITDMSSRKFKVVLLCFDKPNKDNKRSYGELIVILYLKSNDAEAKKKIMANTEELTGLILARGNNTYTIK
ncbi:251_t:CDS:2, partial [Scutellospora calospora]